MRCFNTSYNRVARKRHWYGVHIYPPVGLGLIIMVSQGNEPARGTNLPETYRTARQVRDLVVGSSASVPEKRWVTS